MKNKIEREYKIKSKGDAKICVTPNRARAFAGRKAKMKRSKMQAVRGVKKHIAAGTLEAIKAGRCGSIPGCFFLGASDIGMAKISKNMTIWITWGRNIPAILAQIYICAGYVTVWCGADDGSFELQIPNEIAERLKPVIT